jgi:hypothetical protein
MAAGRIMDTTAMNDEISNEFIKELTDFCLDHYKNLGFYPTEFEWKDKVYKSIEFWPYINFSFIEKSL